MHEPDVPSVDYDVSASAPSDVSADLLCVPVFDKDDALDDVPGADAATGGELGRARAGHEFKARAYDVFVTPTIPGQWKARRIAFVGVGERDGATAERLRRVASTCAYVARARGAAHVAFLLRGGVPSDRFAQAVADGLLMASYDEAAYRQQSDARPKRLERISIVAADAASVDAVTAAARRGRVIGESVNLARALVNEPGNVLPPRELASRIARIGAMAGLSVDVYDENAIRERGMRLLQAVAQGSAEPPRVIVLRHNPPNAPASPVIGLVGKGVTFDSGGISIKPAEGMERMRGDMAGGAAVAAAMRAIARLGSPYRVIGVIPATENMPGSRATRPGDVVKGMNGKTVEINNTDAEGRLILADALVFARSLGATHLIDVATLTGAVVVALGKHVAALFGHPDAWVNTVRDAAERAGDRLWPMPIYEEAREQIRSEIADILNSAGRPGGAITAAAFLREFAGDGAWAHLDIAGTSWAETKSAHQPKGASGTAVRVLTEIGMTGGRTDPR
ncbi:MAG TPA: leucyl aminopeptidase [Vicinamibacterales bacterium]|nr:leucyl aminopeptidase [Vicinamibacterales bacterium]